MEYNEVKKLTKEQKLDFLENSGKEKSATSIAIFMELLQDKSFEVREKAAEVLVEFGNIFAIEELIKAMTSDDPTYRNSAIEALILMGEKVVPHLITQMDNEDADVRKFAIDALGEIKSEKAVPYIIKRLDDENENVMHGACETLGKMKSLEAVEPLIKVLERGEWVQFPAIEALGKIRDSRAIKPILEVMENASDWIKYVSVEALGNIRDESVLEALFKELLSENDEIIEAALSSIEKIIENSTIIKREYIEMQEFYKVIMKLMEILDNIDMSELVIPVIKIIGAFKIKEGVERLVNFLISPDESVSEAALFSIKIFGKDVIINLLNLLEANEGNLDLEIGVIYTLGDVAQGEENVYNKIKKYMRREEEEIREIALETLSKINIKETKSILENAINDKSGNVRRMALHEIYLNNIEIDSEVLFEKLKDKYTDVREAAIKCIVKCEDENKNKKIVAALKRNFDEFNINETKTLMKIAGELETKESVGVIISIIEKYEVLKPEGILTLGKLKSKIAFDYLVDKLRNKEVSIRKMAADALGNINSPVVIDYLLGALEDDDVWVRFFVANSLNNFSSKEISEKFIERLEVEEHVPVIIEILSGLSKYNLDMRFYNTLKKFLDSEDDDIVTAAVYSMKSLGENAWKYKEELLKYFSRDSWKIKKAIMEVFDAHFDKKDIIHILPMIKDENIMVKEKALEIAGRIGGIAVINPMISTMMEENLDEIAKRLLSQVKEEGYGKILEGLKSEYDAVRVFSANALTIIGDKEAVPNLIEALEDKNWKVRYYAAESLGLLKSKIAIPNLVKLLDDENRYVVDMALYSIRKIGG